MQLQGGEWEEFRFLASQDVSYPRWRIRKANLPPLRWWSHAGVVDLLLLLLAENAGATVRVSTRLRDGAVVAVVLWPCLVLALSRIAYRQLGLPDEPDVAAFFLRAVLPIWAGCAVCVVLYRRLRQSFLTLRADARAIRDSLGWRSAADSAAL